MPTYTYAIEFSEAGVFASCLSHVNRSGTTDYDGDPGAFARYALTSYLADVAHDAERRPGEPGAEPYGAFRVVVWEGEGAGGHGDAAAVLYHPPGAETITAAELAAVLKTVKVWLMPERREGVALRGRLLHPEDAAVDIMIAAAHARTSRKDPS